VRAAFIAMRPLLLHPDCRCEAVERIAAEVTGSSPAGLVVRYFVAGDIRGLSLPLPSGPTRTDELWRHSCFELFLRAGEADAYYEFNFSPSLQWAAYRFDNYRQGMRMVEMPAPRIEMRQDGDIFELQAALALDMLLEPDGEADWNLALSAIIEERNGQISYWALAHPSGKPDFHSPNTFALSLPIQIRS
jgi:hypothetical protein